MCFRSHKSCICSGQKEILSCLSIATTKGQVHVALFFQMKTPLEHTESWGGGGGDYCFSLARILSLVSVYVTTSCFVGASILPPGKS